MADERAAAGARRPARRCSGLALNPTSFNLHPTPYILHPAPYTPHPTSYTLQPTPSPSLYRESRERGSRAMPFLPSVPLSRSLCKATRVVQAVAAQQQPRAAAQVTPSLSLYRYRGTSLIKINPLLGSYSRTIPSFVWWSYGEGQFLMSKVPL